MLITGAHVVLFVNGALYGQVMGFSWNSSTPHKEIEGLDMTVPSELAPTRGRAGGTIDLYRVIGDGGAEGAGLAVSYTNLPKAKYFSLMMVERLSNSVIFRADYCTGEQQQWRAVPKSFMTGSLTFKAIGWNNEVTSLTGDLGDVAAAVGQLA